MATTEYGNWLEFAHSDTVEDWVESSLQEWADDYDRDAIVREVRDAVNAELPDDITLAGRNFYGPYPEIDNRAEIIAAAIERATESFWEIAERHDLSQG